MTIFHKIAKHGANFLKSIKSDNTKQILELERLEKQIVELQTREKEVEKAQAQTTGGRMLSNRTSLKFWLIGILALFLAYFIFKTVDILFLILTAFIVSLAIEAIIEFFQKKLRHRGIAIVLAYAGLIVLVLAGLVFVIPFLLSQLSQMLGMVTNNIAGIQTMLKTQSISDIIAASHWIPSAAKEILLKAMADPTVVAGVQTKLQGNISQLMNLGTNYARDIGNLAVNFLGSFVNFLAQTSIVLTLAVLFSIQKTAVMKFISGLRGEKKYKFAYMKLERIYKKLGIWLKSQLLLCIFIGVAVLLGLRILSLFGMSIPQKGSLALIAGITEMIPYIGPLLGGFVACVVAFIHFGRTGVLIVAGLFAIIQRMENNILIPVLMNKTLGVNPVVIFISMIIGGLIIGVLGVLLAVPIAVIITLLLEKTFDE
ncbi:MAG: AI-2E family transporter [candidate division SR1 bacterium]|nr:AI-2E family transporter [candidate division SR1 bacterium]